MGRRGPAPKPTSLRILHGDRRNRINFAEPLPRNLPAERPGFLSPAAAEEWDRIAPDLERMGTVKAVDAVMIAAYCEAVARWRAANEIIAAEGLLVRAEDTVRKHPAVMIARESAAEIRLIGRELGLSPSARSYLRTGAPAAPGGPGRLLTPPVA